jgi:hypothetical protein
VKQGNISSEIPRMNFPQKTDTHFRGQKKKASKNEINDARITTTQWIFSFNEKKKKKKRFCKKKALMETLNDAWAWTGRVRD